MKKVSIYLAVQSRITVCAIEAMLSSLTAVRGEVVGAGTDLKTCIEDIRRLKPELVLADQEVCAVQNTYFCQKLTEENCDGYWLCGQDLARGRRAYPCLWDKAAGASLYRQAETDIGGQSRLAPVSVCRGRSQKGCGRRLAGRLPQGAVSGLSAGADRRRG